MAADSTYTLWVKNFIEIAISCTVSKINAFWDLCRILEWPPKNVRILFLGKSGRKLYIHPGGKKLRRIALSHTVSKINTFLRRISRWPPKLVRKLKNSIRDARTPQPGEIFFNTMRYRSSIIVQSSRYFQSSVSYIKVQIMLK